MMREQVRAIFWCAALHNISTQERAELTVTKNLQINRPITGIKRAKGSVGTVGMGSAMESMKSTDLAVFHSTYQQGFP
jgi:hypothetical protein